MSISGNPSHSISLILVNVNMLEITLGMVGEETAGPDESHPLPSRQLFPPLSPSSLINLSLIVDTDRERKCV